MRSIRAHDFNHSAGILKISRYSSKLLDFTQPKRPASNLRTIGYGQDEAPLYDTKSYNRTQVKCLVQYQLANIRATNPNQTKHTARQHSDSLIWNLSGSTLIHILLILGLGFYITQQVRQPIKHTISVDLVSATQLSSVTQLGSGAEPSALKAPSPRIKRKRIIHTDAKDKPFDKNAFLLEQQRLINEINKQAKVIQKAKRTGFLGVTDTRPAYQQYQKYWQKYVSQFGTNNYPKVLLEKDLAGSLELDITIDKQGVVRATDIHRSSGNTDIDNAAIEIAMLASPYKPLPEEISNQFDALHIIRTWEFKNNALTSKPTTLN